MRGRLVVALWIFDDEERFLIICFRGCIISVKIPPLISVPHRNIVNSHIKFDYRQ